MIRSFQLRCALLTLLMLPVGAIQAAPPAEAFAHLPTFTDLEISPGGKYLAARLNRGNRYTVAIFEILDSKIKYVYALKEDDTLSVDWFEWASGDRLVASMAFTGHRGSRNVVQTEERRLFAIDAANAKAYNLFQDKRDEMPVQIQDRVVSWLPHEPNHILIQYSKLDPQSPNVYRVDVRKPTRHRVAASGRNGVSRWMADAEGDVRLGEGIKNGKEPQLIVREKSEKKWKDLSHRVGVDGIAFDPLGFSAKPNEIYVRSNHEGDPMGLYTFDISNDQFGSLIYKHPSVDVSTIKLDPDNSELLSVNFIDDDVETFRFVERPIHAKVRELREQLGQAEVSTRSVSRDGNFAVIRISGERDAGKYYLFNQLKNTAIALPPQYPDLVDGSLGRTIVTEYAARDGLLIPAFVTLPPEYSSLDELDKIPFVVRPHGGPGARDFMRFDYSVQFLASRGYGVLQMNFRGSTGYGQEFKDAGAREWGQAMQDDITDGAHWLIENAYADPERIAIVGGSYGGYAALMGVVKTPDLYGCAVSFAGVTDLPRLLIHARNFINGRYATRFIGDLWKDRKMLAENSPARRAEEIKAPVLLIHGDQDTVVKIEHSERMAKQLQKHGKEHVFIELEDGDHFRSLYENRLRYLKETEKFLADCLG